MIPSYKLLQLLAAWCLGGVVVMLGMPALWWWLAGAALALGAAMDGLRQRSLHGFQIHRSLPGKFAVGETGRVHLRFGNRTRRAWTVEIFDGIPEGAVTEEMPWRGTVPPGRHADVEYPLRFMERGWKEFGPIHFRLRTPWGLWWRNSLTGTREQVRVFPNYAPVVRFALLAMEARQEQMGIVRRSIAGQSRDFHQLREYREGDPLAQIDWKASSRRQTLISREYQEQRNQTVIFLMDTGRRMRALDGDLPQFDHCLNAALLVSYVALRQGDQVGVQAFAGHDRWLPPVKGPHSMAVLLNHLFDYQTSFEPSDFTQAAERLQTRQRRRALIIVMTNLRGEDSSELIPALDSLATRHLVLLASLREESLEQASRTPVDTFARALQFAAAESQMRERAAVVATLQRRHILTVDVTARELPVSLANRYLDIKAAGKL